MTPLTQRRPYWQCNIYMAFSDGYPNLQPFDTLSMILNMLCSALRDPINSAETWLGCVGLKTASINIERYLGSSAFLVRHGKVSQCSAKLKNSQLLVTYMCLWENKWGFTINYWNRWDSGLVWIFLASSVRDQVHTPWDCSGIDISMKFA